MKTDERMADRISHLERDIKILKNEVQAVLVDLREKYLSAENPLTAASPMTTSQQVVVLQDPVAGPSKPVTDSQGSAKEKEAKDKKEEQPVVSEESKDKKEESVSDGAKDKKGEPETASEESNQKKDESDTPSDIVKDKKEETSGALEPVKKSNLDTAREEVAQAHIPEEVLNNLRPRKDPLPGREINLIAIGGLVNWAEESVRKLGLQKTEAILDVAEMMGLLSPQLKQIMLKLINTDSDGKMQSVSARVFLDSLVKITTLLGKDNQTEAALLSILSREDEPWIK